MLAAPSDRRYGATRIRSVLTLERRFRAHLVVREQLVFDSRFAAPAFGGPIATVYLMMSGSFQPTGGPVIRGPVAFVLAETEFERRVPGAATFRSWGDPSVTIEIRVAIEDVRIPVGLRNGPVAISPATWETLHAAYQALEDGRSTDAAKLELVRALARDGVLAEGVASSTPPEELDSYVRVWNAVTPIIGSLSTSASIFALAKSTGLSVRQLQRDVKQLAKTFGLPGEGFRDSMRVMRLRTAVVLLSAPNASATEVARLVGYHSLEAMGRALRDAQLPQPSVIREQVGYLTMPSA